MVKKLILIRHAKSSWDNPLLDGFGRPWIGEDINKIAKSLVQRGDKVIVTREGENYEE